MSFVGFVLMTLLNVAWWLLVVYIIMGWLVNFQVLNLRQPIVAQIYFGLNRLLEPVFAPIRRFLPNTGGLDFSPIVVFIGIIIAQGFVIRTF